MDIRLKEIGQAVVIRGNKGPSDVDGATGNGVDSAREFNTRSSTRRASSQKEVQLPFNTTAYFSLDEDGNVVIKIVDREGKLLRQIPPEEYIAMMRNLKKAMENLFKLGV